MLDFEKLHFDLEQYAGIVGAEYDVAAVEKTIEILAELDRGSTWVGIRTTTKPEIVHEVNFRACYRNPIQPVPLLLEAGLLTFSGHPIEQLLNEVETRFSPFWGVDAGTCGAVDKFWLFFAGGIDLDDFLTLQFLPLSVHKAQKHFDRAGIGKIDHIGLDFTRYTMNIYSPILAPGSLSVDMVANLIGSLGFKIPPADVLNHNAKAFNIYQTFDWESEGILRLCFPTRYGKCQFPTDYHPILKEFVEQAPFAAAIEPYFVFSTTAGPRGGYLKAEADYSGNLGQLFNWITM